MNNLSDRQKNLLLSIIREFILTAEAVGSISLQNKYGISFSTATIRNEMADLVEQGYLFQKHHSGGRIPTTKAWRYFVNQLDKSIDSPSIDFEIHLNSFENKNDLLRRAIQKLSFLTGNTSILLIDREAYYSGLSELVKIPEFRDSNNLKKMLQILEDYYTLSEILNRENLSDDVNILIGEEIDNENFYEYSIIFSELRVFGDKKGYIAVIGPTRMDYANVINAISYISKIVRKLFIN